MNILRQVVRSLVEAAVTAKEAKAADLALYVSVPPKTGNWENADRVYILYSPSIFLKAIEESPETIDAESVIVGAIALIDHEGECNNASSVVNVAAVKGYGPLMYNIAGTGRQITAHREQGGVKAGARNVWNHFYSGKAHAIPFDDPYNPRDDDPTNDCDLHYDEPLDHSYAGIRTNYAPLAAAHRQFVELVTEKGMASADLADAIERLGNEFYFSKYLTSPF